MEHIMRRENTQNAQNQNETPEATNKIVAIIPKIIGSIPVSELDNNKDYFKCLLTSIQTARLHREKGKKYYMKINN